jgi:hypothetical protein
MTVTTTTLTRAAGLAAVAAGLLFILIQFIHPQEGAASVTTTAWTVTHALGVVMAALTLVGISGMYLRQVRETGLPGLIGFVLFGSCYLLITAFEFVEAFVLPAVADQAPQFVDDFLAIAATGVIVGDVVALVMASAVTGVTYVLGGLLFGVALFRAGILARWAAVLLAVGSVGTLSVSVLPLALDRLIAVPLGVALAGLGYSLWREQRTPAGRSLPSAAGPQLDPAGAQ